MIRKVYIDAGATHMINVKHGETVQIYDRETRELLKTVRYDEIEHKQRIKVGC
ncbi:hypothetical protein N007_05510 [Alicyclobacillus acidoterrestris ATCC 49025]|nr:hypothetical protein N007_05510 [Alicyclobacillus acidoterrestris ATCC 49025]